MTKQRIEADIISQLPDDLLIRILSLLPDDADATRSSILSNRWKHLWVFLPNLHFVIPQIEKQADKYIESVDHTLALRGGTPIQKLFLQSDYLLSDYRVYNWLREVEELEFRFYFFDVNFYRNMFRFCNNTLIKLTLQGFMVVLRPEIEIIFPCLKEMNLQCTRIKYLERNSLMVLISRCPVLEELCLDSLGSSYNLDMVKLFSSSMRRLTIKRIEYWELELVINDAPKLECLHLDSCYFYKYTLVKPTSPVEAHISDGSWFGFVIQLLRCVSSTKILTLTRESLLLCLGMIMSSVLELLPSVMKWNPKTEEAPACIRFKLKEIFVVSYATLEEVAIINYLLKHATILEKLTISELYPERHEPWLNIQCVSKSCRIGFV